jgi:hypothetical protein
MPGTRSTAADHRPRRPRRLLLPLGAALLLAGCAGAAGGVTPRPGPAASGAPDLAPYQVLSLQVARAQSVQVSDQEQTRLADGIAQAIRTRPISRFREVVAGPPIDTAGPVLDVVVELTRYERGNAFARAMMAGLGRIHIDGLVRLVDRATGVQLGEYEVTKTFAWGGLYGASTRIEDVEAGFAQGVAEVVLAGPGR